MTTQSWRPQFPDGSLRTGDAGAVDDEGFLYIRDRYKTATGKIRKPDLRDQYALMKETP